MLGTYVLAILATGKYAVFFGASHSYIFLNSILLSAQSSTKCMEYRHVPSDSRNASNEYERKERTLTKSVYMLFVHPRLCVTPFEKQVRLQIGYTPSFSFALFMGVIPQPQPLICHCRRCWSVHLFVSYICICPFFSLLLLSADLDLEIYYTRFERHDILPWAAWNEEHERPQTMTIANKILQRERRSKMKQQNRTRNIRVEKEPYKAICMYAKHARFSVSVRPFALVNDLALWTNRFRQILPLWAIIESFPLRQDLPSLSPDTTWFCILIFYSCENLFHTSMFIFSSFEINCHVNRFVISTFHFPHYLSNSRSNRKLNETSRIQFQFARSGFLTVFVITSPSISKMFILCFALFFSPC